MPSTGPVTPRGKAAVSLNGLKHGLRTVALVIPNVEDEDEWAAFEHAVVESLSPDGAVESTLAARVAEVFWRLRRISRAERDLVVAHHRHMDTVELRRARAARAESSELPATSFYAGALASAAEYAPPRRVLPDDSNLQQIIRYEAHLNRQLYLAMHELEVLQDRRKGRAAPLARVQVHGLPEE